jgi:ABC-type transport system involved in multi-copper enzyme maturation permease subunit
MKLLAILRDSLKETLDVKLFYVMVGLSLLVVLLVGSITYKPVSVQERIEFVNKLQNLAIRQQLAAQPQTQSLDFHLNTEEFQKISDEPEPWLANYRFMYVVTLSIGKEAAKLGPEDRKLLDNMKDQFKKAITAEQLERNFHELFPEVKVREAPSDNPEKICYEVTTSKGTVARTRQEWFHEPRLFFGLVPIPVPLFSLNNIINFIGDQVIGSFGAAFTMLISTIMTASFVPNMLAKGTVDMLLVKPIHRVTLLIYKFLGGLIFMFFNTVVIMVGIWLGLGLQSGMWVNAFLLCIFVYTFQFTMFYAVSAMVAVLTRSAIVCILASFMTWGVLVLVGWTHWFFIEKDRPDKPVSTTGHWAYVSYDAVHNVLPRYKDLDWLTSKEIKRELHQPTPATRPDLNDPASIRAYEQRQRLMEAAYKSEQEKLDKEYGAYTWTSSLIASSLFIALMLGLACWRFATRDY